MIVSSTVQTQAVTYQKPQEKKSQEELLAELKSEWTFDEALLGFGKALSAKLGDESGVANSLVLTALGFYDGYMQMLFEKFDKMYPLRPQPDANIEIKDPMPQEPDLTKVGLTEPMMGALGSGMVRSQAEMISRLELYHSRFETLLTNRDKVEQAYTDYMKDFNDWAVRNKSDQRIEEAELYKNMVQKEKLWQREGDVFKAALELAKEYDFFTKKEFVG